MDTQKNKAAIRSFASGFAAALSQSLGNALGSEWPLAVLDGHEPSARRGQTLQFRLRIEGSLHGECFVEFYEPQVSELAARLGGEAHASGDTGKHLAPVIAAATANLKASLAEEFGDLNFNVDSVTGLAFGGMLVVPLASSASDTETKALLYLDNGMVSSLTAARGVANTPESKSAAASAANLKLVMDVELNVSLRFGQRQLPLREVLELTSGSVIELDRMVDEPVELLLDGKVVARGEAVIVDGNYGLRVTEIPQAIESHFA